MEQISSIFTPKKSEVYGMCSIYGGSFTDCKNPVTCMLNPTATALYFSFYMMLTLCSWRLCWKALGGGRVFRLPVSEWPQPHDDPTLLRAAWEFPRHWGHGEGLSPGRVQSHRPDEGISIDAKFQFDCIKLLVTKYSQHHSIWRWRLALFSTTTHSLSSICNRQATYSWLTTRTWTGWKPMWSMMNCSIWLPHLYCCTAPLTRS